MSTYHACMISPLFFLRFVDGFWPDSQSPRCLPSLIKTILWRGQMHYTVFVTWDLLLCAGGHARRAREVKRAAKLNCFYKSVSHYAFRVQIRMPLCGRTRSTFINLLKCSIQAQALPTIAAEPPPNRSDR